jgi:hypothetical protein
MPPQHEPVRNERPQAQQPAAQVPAANRTAQQVRNNARGTDFAGGQALVKPPLPADTARQQARKKGKLEGLTFAEMWAAHPHNDQPWNEDGTDPNTPSSQVLEDQGWSPDEYGNTCAIRLSIMLNKQGGAYLITPARAAQAGIAAGRLRFSKKTRWYYILAAGEVWKYLSVHFGKPHQEWPARGRFKDSDAFNAAFEKDIRPVIASRKGIVAFDKIFTYSGTGHMDIFDGEKLSDSSMWYPSQSIKVWYVNV